MALESATYINGLVAANPTATDPKSQGDDHIRLLKSTIQATFPSITGAVTATQAELNILDGATVSTAELNILDGATVSTAELNILDGVTATTTQLNYLSGVTSDIQGQLNTEAAARAAADALLAPLASPDLTGTPTAPTAAPGTGNRIIASTEYVDAALIAAVINGIKTSDFVLMNMGIC